MASKHDWLRGEIDAWEREGVVGVDLADKLRARYPRGSGGSRSAAVIGIAVLGALLLGGGIILLLAHNWADLSRGVRTAVALVPLVIAQMLAFVGAVRGRDGAGWREGLAVFWTLSIGAAIAMVSQIYHLSGSYDAFMLTWLLLTLPVIYLMRSSLAAVLYVFGVVGWSRPLAGELPRVLGYWPLTAAILPLLLRSSREGTFTSGLALLRWVLTASLFVGVGITLAHALPGLWMVIYAALLSVFYLLDLRLLHAAPSLWHRPMRVAGILGCVVLSLMLTYEWPWKNIGWHYWRDELPVWQQLLDCGAALGLMSGAVLLAALSRKQWRLSDLFPAGFFLVALAGYFFTAQWGHPGGSLLIFNLFVFLFGLALLVSGVRAMSLGSVNAGMLLLAVVIALRFFDSDMNFLSRGLIFVALGGMFLGVNTVLSRKFRRAS